MGVFGDADIAADEPVCVGFDRRAGDLLGGEGEDDIAGEDVGADGALDEEFWGGVGEGAGCACCQG